jgi:hypothetical protein
MTSLTVGVAGPNQLTEDYVFDGVLGLLSHQCVLRAGNALLDLSYEYLQPEGGGWLRPVRPKGRTGQVTRIIDNLDR